MQQRDEFGVRLTLSDCDAESNAPWASLPIGARVQHCYRSSDGTSGPRQMIIADQRLEHWYPGSGRRMAINNEGRDAPSLSRARHSQLPPAPFVYMDVLNLTNCEPLFLSRRRLLPASRRRAAIGLPQMQSQQYVDPGHGTATPAKHRHCCEWVGGSVRRIGAFADDVLAAQED
jgi:hypothetical protein